MLDTSVQILTSRIIAVLVPFLLMMVTISNAQNLVPNPSFEDTVGCPSLVGDIDKAEGWTSLCGTPDYFNPCANPSIFGAPHNFGGYQVAAGGQAYTGFMAYHGLVQNLREVPSCELLSPLNVGTKYYVSLKIALSLSQLGPSNHATNRLGIKFITQTYLCYSLVNSNAQVYTDSIITDSLNWTRITGSFVADSAYTRLVVGNFFEDVDTDTIKFFDDVLNQDNAYYYLDDVCVGADSSYVFNYEYDQSVGLIISNTPPPIKLFPNPFIDQLIIQNKSPNEMDIEVYNMVGQTLFRLSEVSDPRIAISLGHLPSGFFVVRIRSGGQIKDYKLLKR